MLKELKCSNCGVIITLSMRDNDHDYEQLSEFKCPKCGYSFFSNKTNEKPEEKTEYINLTGENLAFETDWWMEYGGDHKTVRIGCNSEYAIELDKESISKMYDMLREFYGGY